MHTFFKYFFAIMVMALLVRVKQCVGTPLKKRESDRCVYSVRFLIFINIM